MSARAPTLLRGGDPNGAENPGDKPPAAVGEKFKVGKFEVSEAELEAMLRRQSHEDLKKATLPAKAEDYRLELFPAIIENLCERLYDAELGIERQEARP